MMGSNLLEDVWSDLLLSHRTSSCLRDVNSDAEMREVADLLPEKQEAVSARNTSLSAVFDSMDAERSLETLDVLGQQASSVLDHSEGTTGVHWLEEKMVGEREPKRQKSDDSSQRTTSEEGSILSTSPSTLTFPPTVQILSVQGLEKPKIDSHTDERPSEVFMSTLDSPSRQQLVLEAAFQISSSDSTCHASQKLKPRAKSVESISRGLPEPLSLVKTANTNQDHEKDQNVSPNVLRPLSVCGQGRKLVAPSQPELSNQVRDDKSGSHVDFVERNKGGPVISSSGPFVDSGLPRESRWAEQLLMECAMAISSKNFVRTQHLMWVLNDLGSLTGDANQRLAAHGLKALFCRVTGTGETDLSDPMMGKIDASPKVVHRALLKFHDVNPWHQMVYTVANSVMLDYFEGEDKVHVIDIGVSQGTQWPTFIEALATRASGAPSLLRLTVVKEDEGVGFSSGASPTDFMSRLERFAKLMGINILLSTVTSSLQKLTGEMLGLREGEALAICAQFRLHRLPETAGYGKLEGSGTSELSSPRDSCLKFLYGLKPKVVILSENDADHLSSDFLMRFYPVVDYFWKFLDSTSFSFLGKQCEERQIIESEMALAMINNVAWEGGKRLERNECHMSWAMRMKRIGFVPLLPREEILDNVRGLIRKYDANWDYAIDANCVVLLWKHQPVTFSSVWKPD